MNLELFVVPIRNPYEKYRKTSSPHCSGDWAIPNVAVIAFKVFSVERERSRCSFRLSWYKRISVLKHDYLPELISPWIAISSLPY